MTKQSPYFEFNSVGKHFRLMIDHIAFWYEVDNDPQSKIMIVMDTGMQFILFTPEDTNDFKAFMEPPPPQADSDKKADDPDIDVEGYCEHEISLNSTCPKCWIKQHTENKLTCIHGVPLKNTCLACLDDLEDKKTGDLAS